MFHELFFDGAEKTYAYILDDQPYTFPHDREVSTVESEAIALLEGLKKAVELEIQHLKIYGDSKVVINQALGASKVRGPSLRSIFSEIMAYLTLIPFFEINWIPRAKNKADAYSRGKEPL